MIAKTDSSEKIMWLNPRSSSTRFCMPIRFQFIKERQDIIIYESDYVESQISSLLPTNVSIDGKNISIRHILMKTMLDGKIANALAGNSSTQSCYICKVTPKNINDIDSVIKRPCNINTFQYGLSILHAHIRFFECILHISYRLNIKTWLRGSENKRAFEEKKHEIISKFREETGLLVNVIKQGSGSTNDGNTAKRFFKDSQKAAQITGVDKNLISRFSVILQAISCGYKLNSEAFRNYAHKTAKLFVQLYKWYKMPASVHKILIHGADVIDTLLLPIGQLSEEALEARHKECRYYREHNTRKINRKQNVEDLLHALLISSDPLISSLRPLPKRKTNELPQEVIKLLEIPECSQGKIKDDEIESSTNEESDDSAHSDLDL